MTRAESFEEVAIRAINVHGNSYKYLSFGEKTSGGLPTLVMVCPKHGVFTQDVQNHLSGKGCATCAIEATRMTQTYFLEGVAKQPPREETYDYSEAIVIDSKTKVKIICPQHGPFWQSPATHLQGSGCPSCAVTGFKAHKPGSLYVLSDGHLTKIGITNRAVKTRTRHINQHSGKNFMVVAEFYFDYGGTARRLETEFLRNLRAIYEQPEEVFDGHTETFLNVDIPKLLSEIQLSEVPNEHCDNTQ